MICSGKYAKRKMNTTDNLDPLGDQILILPLRMTKSEGDIAGRLTVGWPVSKDCRPAKRRKLSSI